ncbi:MAG: 30S ribosomal protein S6 [Candidatus Babeliales bacterium]|jgi:small subunit ribosomal protein S6
MTLQRYEVLLLTVPEITSDESKDLEKQLNKLVKDVKGSVISFDRWGKYRLVYPVKKNDYGVYYLFRFEVPQNAEVPQSNDEFIQEIKTLFKVKLNNIVMRSLFTHLEAKASLAYQRPKSLEEVPVRDVETFLKENKMEGLLSAVDSSPREEKKIEQKSIQEETDDNNQEEKE